MTKQEFILLTEKYTKGGCTQDEEKLIFTFCEEIQLKGSPPDWDINEEEMTKIKILASINQHIDKQNSQSKVSSIRRESQGIRWAWRVAAILVLSVGLGWWMFHSEVPETPVSELTKTTLRGQKATIKLPDGSEVKLNAESSITYLESFAASNTRSVELKGEAFFDVVENKRKPFIVKTDQVDMTVLGTTFNVNAYSEKPAIQITLETGKIKVETNQATGISRSVEINPGQQIRFVRATREMHKSNVELKDYLSWKEGTIILDAHTIEETARILERWYNVSFEFQEADLKYCRISGEFKSDNLKNILSNIEFLTNLDFVLEGRKVTVKGNPCKSN